MKLKNLRWVIACTLLILSVLCLSAVSADTVDSGSCGENLNWTLDSSGTLTISGTGPMENYSYSDSPWESYCENIYTIRIESGVTSIGGEAFRNFMNLTDITVPASVTDVGADAFFACTSLSQLSLPGVRSIGYFAFYRCESLTEFTVPDGVTVIEDYTFAECKSMTRIQIPASVTEISDSAFNGCSNIVLVVDRNSPAAAYCLENLFRYAYSDAPNDIQDWKASGDYLYFDLGGNTAAIVKYTGSAVNLTVPAQLDGKTVVRIGREAFHEGVNYDLYSVTLPDSITRIDANAFEQCVSLRSIHLPKSLLYIGSAAFSETDLRSIDFPDGLQVIEKYAFLSSRFTSLTIPGSVTLIGSSAFSGSTDGPLASVTILEGEDELIIGDSAFSGCTALTDLTIPARLTSIGASAFARCTSLTSLNLSHTGLSSISDSTFSGCTGLSELTLPETLKTIGSNAFSDCTNLKTVQIPAGVTSLGYGAFGGSGITGIRIPRGVTAIPFWCFSNCAGLTSIRIPATVTSIAASAFNGSESVTIECEENSAAHAFAVEHGIPFRFIPSPDFVLPAGLSEIQEEAFAGISAAYVYIPDGAVRIGSRAFADCGRLTVIRIPASVTAISSDAFQGTGSLTICGEPGSAAQEFAETNGFDFEEE